MEERICEDWLTPEEISVGWHYCRNWEWALIGPGDPKMDSCNCKVNKSIHEQIKKKCN